jgi:predicted glycoside hydrolase/deacetylase ChbG (UPF0249 family)
MIRRVVFNADDLGAGARENAGVLSAARAGIVREASLLVTGEAGQAAVSAVHGGGVDLGIGLHFSLTLGRALTGPISGLTDSAGRFSSLPIVLLRSLAGAIDPEPVRRELCAQLDRLNGWGVEPTHLNGHHHVHIFPGVREVVLDIARGLPGLHVRVPLEAASPTLSPRLVVIRALATAFADRARAALPGFRPLPFVGLKLATAGDHAPAFARLARTIRMPAAEWIVHPCAPELATLQDPRTRQLLDDLRIVPSRYSELTGSAARDAEAGP